MKKTGAAIFTLTLALILVSSLSSGVLLADGDDHDNRKKNKNKYETVTVRDVAILDCGFEPTEIGGPLIVVGFQTSTDDVFEIIVDDPADRDDSPSTCAGSWVVLLNHKFKPQDGSGGGMFAITSRHTFVRTTKMRVLREDD